MIKLPTDREVMECIYKMYSTSYPGNLMEGGCGENDPFVPIDIKKIAASLGAQPVLIFGRLYYHLDPKYRHEQSGGGTHQLFVLDVQNKGKSVNFPYLVALLAEQNQEHRKQLWSLCLSIVAICISMSSLIVSILTNSVFKL